ncbi:MAG: pseudouridine synthase, Rsu [Phenylobacterium sp.]|nr:pseudouridine synthase, Rsu [Phenylobacterium sp.]
MVHDPQRTHPAPTGQANAAEDGPEPGGGERVAKALARAGVASRREVERLIEAGRVALNGKTLTTPAVKVDPGDVLTVDGQVVNEAEPTRVFRYHKPPGLMTTHNDPQGRPTVFEALPKDLPRLISVGRLDLNTEGLLLLTNDGGLARALELPETGVVRRYRARARGRITQERLDRLKHGVTVEGVRYGAIEATLDKAREAAPGSQQGANLWITLTLSEGKNREVRRVLESLGLSVNRLIRLAYGPFALGTLGVGQVEEVGPRVIREQLADHVTPANLPKGERAQWKPPAAQARRRAPQTEAEAERAHRQRTAETEPKKEYKAGWAKPKIKPKPAQKAKPPRVSGAKGGPRAIAKAGSKSAPRTAAPAPRSGARKPGGTRRPGGRGPRG